MRTKMQPLTLADSLKCTAQHSTKISRYILICAPETECAVCVYIQIYLNRYLYIFAKQAQPSNKIGRDSSDLTFRGQ